MHLLGAMQDLMRERAVKPVPLDYPDLFPDGVHNRDFYRRGAA